MFNHIKNCFQPANKNFCWLNAVEQYVWTCTPGYRVWFLWPETNVDRSDEVMIRELSIESNDPSSSWIVSSVKWMLLLIRVIRRVGATASNGDLGLNRRSKRTEANWKLAMWFLALKECIWMQKQSYCFSWNKRTVTSVDEREKKDTYKTSCYRHAPIWCLNLVIAEAVRRIF
jgi:hypothetical protein